MTEGLLYVLSEPGAVRDEEFHDWYDTEHGPARLSVPGIRAGYRYREGDGARPSWLAWYELELSALKTPEYERIRRRGPREQSVVGRLAVLDRRVYELVGTWGHCASPAPVVVSVGLSGDAAELERWYREEHVPMLLEVSGWRRIRRYRKLEGSGPDLLAFHEIDSTDLFRSPAYQRAVSTPWRTRAMALATARERRVFRYHNTVAAGSA